MPRPRRVHVPGALYFVTCKALEGLLLFRETKDYEAYLQFLQEARQHAGFKLFAYVLLADRVHLCLELTGETTISEIMHALSSRYTKYYNKQHNHAGHLLQERFKSTLMEKAPSLLPITGFIHRLPEQSGTAVDWASYRWSSYSRYLVTDPREVSDEVKEVLEALSRMQSTADYADYVGALTKVQLDQLELQTHQHLVGSDSFCALVESQAVASSRPQDKRLFSKVASPPSRPPSSSSAIFAGSIVIAALALSAIGFYAKNISMLRQKVQALAKERLVFVQAPQEPQAAMASISSGPLSVFSRPSRLAGTAWDVQVIRTDSTGAKAVVNDELTFSMAKVASSLLTAQGFEPSNYSLSLEPDGKVLWETMQTGRAGEIVCWRGEWSGERMQGVMTRQLPGSPAMNFSFIGIVRPGADGATHMTREI